MSPELATVEVAVGTDSDERAGAEAVGSARAGESRKPEGHGPRRCLLTMVDDATSHSAGRFSAEETIWAAVAVLLARQSRHAPARSTVTVCEWPDGRLAIEYRGHPMTWTDITGRPPIAVPPAAPTPTPAAAPMAALTKAIVRREHPWRRSYRHMHTPTKTEAPLRLD